MPQWFNLPFEVLYLILQRVDNDGRNKQDLVQCMLTCQTWNRVAVEILYTTIRFEGTSRAHELIFSFLSRKNKKKGKLVKNLYYMSGPSYANSEQRVKQHVLKFSNLFPCLEKFHVTWNTFGTNIQEILLNHILKGKFPNLKKIPDSPRPVFSNKLYDSCLRARKSTLDSIVFIKDYWEEGLGVDTYAEIKEEINQFSKLKFVELRVYADDERHTIPGVMEYITSIPFHLYQRVHLRIRSMTSSMLLSNEDDINSIDSMTNVKHLNIKCAYGNYTVRDKLKLQLMKRFPNLDYFSMQGEFYYGDVTQSTFSSIEIGVQFLKFLFKIKKCSVDYFIAINKTNINDYLSILNDTCAPPLKNHLKIKYVDDYDSLKYISTSYTEYHLGFEQDMYTKIRTFTFNYYQMKKTTGHSKSEALDLIQQTGQYFKHLELAFVPTATMVVLMEDVLERCAHLHTLVIERPNIRSKITRLSRKTKNASAYPSMNTLVLSRCHLYSELFEFISIRFPCLKSLSIETYDSGHNVETYHIPIIMKNVSLECIHLCITRVFVLIEKHIPPFYIKLVTEDVKDRLYYLDLKKDKFVPHQQTKVVNFDECIENKHCLTVLVHCKSVKKLIVKYYDGSFVKFKELVIE